MTRYFSVANHAFSVNYDMPIPAQVFAQYEPFETLDAPAERLFDVTIVDQFDVAQNEAGQIVVEGRVYDPKIVDTQLSRDDMVRVDVYCCEESILYQIFMPQSEVADSTLVIDKAAKCATLYLNNRILDVLNNGLIITYFTFANECQTLLLHASAVLLDGRAQIFLGRSGTGKSTHSDQWLKCFPEAELLNDDHPVVRIEADGEIRLYGSPWSGKRPIYRAISAPLAAIVRITRAKSNRAIKLSPLRAYASLLTTTSSMQWDKEMMEKKIATIEGIIAGVVNLELEALPDVDSARVCHKAIMEG